MGKAILFILLGLPVGLFGANPEKVHLLLNVYQQSGILDSRDTARLTRDLDNTYLDSKGNFSVAMLQLSRTIHKRYLKEFDSQADLQSTMKSGRYNCLTAVTLFTFYLEHFQLDYELIETDFHIFILVQPPNGTRILLETTDPLSGVITGEACITARIDSYRNQASSDMGREIQYQYKSKIEGIVSPEQLAGMHHYNKAVYYFNSRDLSHSIASLELAVRYYTSSRIEELAGVLKLTLVEDQKFEPEVKSRMIQQLQQIRRVNARWLALRD